MKKMIVFLVLIALLAAAMPAQASREFVGDRINIYDSGEQIFPANQPFHIFHGWELDPGKSAGGYGQSVGNWGFRLEVDDKPVEPDFKIQWGWGNPDEYAPGQHGLIYLFMVYNFPNGMIGTHTFHGYWYRPCSAWDGSKNCPDPMAPVVTYEAEVKVTFNDE